MHGFCDCGDDQSWKITGFCENHEGPKFKKVEEKKVEEKKVEEKIIKEKNVEEKKICG